MLGAMDRDRRRAPRLDWTVLAAGAVGPLVLAILVWSMVGRIEDAGLRDAVAVRDTLFFWTGGLLARLDHAGAVFDPATFQAAMGAVAGDRITGFTWSYPPPMLLLAVPLSLLSLKAAFVAWNAAGAVLLWLGARAAGLVRAARLVALVSPAAVENALSGQTGLLTAALLLPGLVLLDRRPWIAGALLGAGLILKPQLFVLAPLCMLASGNWRAALSAALSASALVGASAAAFGWEGWVGFLTQTAPYMRRAMLEADWFNGPYQSMMATPFMAARWAGAPVAAAYAVQAVSALGAGILCWRAWRRGGTGLVADPLARAALTLALGFLASPYGMSYDMTALAAALAGLAARDGLPRGAARLLFATAWIWPGCGCLLGVVQGPPLGLAAALCAVALGWRACRAGRRAAPSRVAGGVTQAA